MNEMNENILDELKTDEEGNVWYEGEIVCWA